MLEKFLRLVNTRFMFYDSWVTNCVLNLTKYPFSLNKLYICTCSSQIFVNVNCSFKHSCIHVPLFFHCRTIGICLGGLDLVLKELVSMIMETKLSPERYSCNIIALFNQRIFGHTICNAIHFYNRFSCGGRLRTFTSGTVNFPLK